MRILSTSGSLVLLLAAACTTRPVAGRVQDDQTSTIAAISREMARRYGPRVLVDADHLRPSLWPGVSYEGAGPGDAPQLLEYLRILQAEIGKYPRRFVEASGVQVIALVSDLRFRGQARWALPDYVSETLYLDFRVVGSRSRAFARRVIHHEYFHLLEEQWSGEVYFQDPEWSKLNPPDHEYGPGGARVRTIGVGDPTHPGPGFINAYALSGLEEDKAEVWSAMMVPELWSTIEPWLAHDANLRRKIAHLEAFARSKDPAMNDDFWQRVRSMQP